MIAPGAGALLGGRRIVQACWVVPALEPAIAQWRTAFGTGPWVIVGNEGTVNRRYRGNPTDLRYTAALAQAGDLQIELIEQATPGPSCYRDIVPEGASGLHHLAFFASDFEGERARLASAGFETAFQAEFADVRFAYIDCSPAIGCMVEILEDKPTLREMFALPGLLAANWDGVTRPVRTIAEVMEDLGA